MAFYNTVKVARKIVGKVYAVECYKTIAIHSQQTAFGRLELCLVQQCEKIPRYDIIEANSGCILIKDCGRLQIRGFHNICKLIAHLAAEKIIATSKENPKITDLPEWKELQTALLLTVRKSCRELRQGVINAKQCPSQVFGNR